MYTNRIKHITNIIRDISYSSSPIIHRDNKIIHYNLAI